MKKIYSFMVGAVALLAAVSCAQELEQAGSKEQALGETVVYTASTDDPDAKAVLNETTKKSEWVAGDAITVHDGEQGWTFTAAEAGANVDFSNSEGFGDYRPVMAVYPAGTYTADVNAKTVNAYIPTYQPARKGTYNEGAALAVAYSENDQFAFKNAHSLIKFTIKSSNIKAIEFYGNNNEAITGDVYVTLGEDGVKSVKCLETVFTWEDNTTSTQYGTWVKIYSEDETNGWCFENGATYYAAVAPVNFTKGVAINYILADDTKVEAVKKTDNPVNLTPSKILNIGDLEYEAPATVETVYLQPGVWSADGAWFSAHFFNSVGGAEDVKMTDEDADGVYEATVPAGMESVMFCRMNPEFTEFGWDVWEGETEVENHVWNQTGDLVLPLAGDDKVYYKVTGWDTPGIWWNNIPEPVTPDLESAWALAGTFNSWGDKIFVTTTTADLFVIKSITIDAGDEIKVKAVGSWDTSYGGGIKYLQSNKKMTVYSNGSNIPVATAGTYDVYFDLANTKLYLMEAGTSYTSATDQTSDGPAPAAPSNWYIVGNFNGWNPADEAYRMLDDGTYYIFDNFTAVAGCEMKFAPGKWSGDKGASGSFSANTWLNTGSSNIAVSAGTYKIYFKKDGSQYKFEKK